MHAHLGDRLIVESPSTGLVRRDGEIVGLHHEDGTPPYDVRWSDTGDVTLVFPGPDAHIRHGRPGPAQEPPAETGGPTAVQPGDVGRRLAAARRRRGLGVDEAARRARMSPQYLDYLETHASDPSVGTLLRLADALGTTLVELQGGDQERPPGQGQALYHPVLRDLGEQECRSLLSTHGVGRVSLTTPHGPAVFPVNYEVADETIAFRTAPDAAPAAAVGNQVAFEVDHVDDAMSQGWSVLAVGRADAVTDPGAVRRLENRAHTAPWAGGRRTLWVSITVDRLTGRRITSADAV
ncbi:pyridoxamine 5'-phosphate oxidase family protein [Streptomyces djakartensis]|uniref:DNA-binding protein n=1 Tax=Streptomyces djakartensis TaxID=68193 RepID=A0ABQ3A502_9ACTN|nr:pyridoxamine 5'-phosphate oxidase family protein [Streptomyces djakartensis]GGY33402.1 DNA-binding protein [Streptomyces djakartensis]